jgi:heme exporter protein C
MGTVSLIFYFHVPNAVLMILISTISGLASGWYIARRQPLADRIALATAELTVALGVIVLLTGPLWARKSWGVWWVWEPRLTSTLIMWLVFSSYLLLRRFGGAGSELLGAAVGIFGAVLSPFVYWSVNMWRTLHPTTNVLPSLPAPMAGPVLWCATAFVALYVALILLRVRLESARVTLERAWLLLEED